MIKKWKFKFEFDHFRRQSKISEKSKYTKNLKQSIRTNDKSKWK
jgi:hypothetical protein